MIDTHQTVNRIALRVVSQRLDLDLRHLHPRTRVDGTRAHPRVKTSADLYVVPASQCQHPPLVHKRLASLATQQKSLV